MTFSYFLAADASQNQDQGKSQKIVLISRIRVRRAMPSYVSRKPQQIN
jgi:hypothetical protein